MAFVSTLTGDPANAMTQLHANTERLRAAFIGATAPTDVTATEGQLWLDNSSDPHVLRVYIDTAGSGTPTWQEVTSLITADVDYALNAAINFIIENVGSDMVPSGSNIGRVALSTARDTPQTILTSGQLGHFAMLRNDRRWPIEAPPASWHLDATNPPTPAEVAMTGGGSFRGLLFDAVNERMSRFFRVPAVWSTNQDLVLRVHFLLNAAEISGDDVKGEIDWRRGDHASAENFDGTSENFQLAKDLGATVAQYTANFIDLVIDHDAVGNVIGAGDLINVEFGLYAIDEVASIIVVDTELLVPMGFLLGEQ